MKSLVSLRGPTAHSSFDSSLRPAFVIGCILAVVLTVASETQAQSYSDWSVPSNLGTAINSTANDQQPAISPDGLSLYFTSNRTGGLGGFDMYVSHRTSSSDPWGPPANLGPSLNTSSDEGNAAFSLDGRLLFFQSKRSGGLGGIDLWLARRNDPQNDFDWQPPVNLGPSVNSTADDNGPAYFEDEVRGTRQLYFGSNRSGGPGGSDIYVAEQMTDDSFAMATLVPALNSTMNENDPSIRRGGLEIIFQSNRTGSIGGSSDLWVATRPTALAAWSTPVNLMGTINAVSAEQNAYLSSDAMVLFLSSDRTGGSGGLDLYVSTRARTCSPGELYGASPGGTLITINQADGYGTVVGSPDVGMLNGLAFDSRGRLFASTISGTSTLIQIDPDTGTLISTIGPINIGGTPISIGDLSFQPDTDVLFGTRSNADGALEGGKLYTINVATAAATLVGDTGAGAGGGIAFAPNGTLYQAAHNSHFDYRSLNTIDPVDAHRIRTVPLTAYYDGLGVRPSDGLLIATLGGSDSVYTINADTGAEVFVGYTSQGVSDVDFRKTCGIDVAQFFVRQHYRDFLNRAPDAMGLAFWTNEIAGCGTDSGCIEVKRINVSAAFFISIEFQETGYLVYRTYKSSYGNLPGAPVPLTFSEFLPDTQQIGHGVIVNDPGWELLLESNKQAFLAEFVQRSRFTSAYPTVLTPEQFVDQLFMNGGVTPSATDRAAAINEFGSAMNTADTAARARALRLVAENSKLKQQEFNRAFVLMQYFGYLRRNPPDPPEPTLDFQGYNFWLTKLNQFNGNFADAEMVKAFLVSGEYRQRFGP